VRQLRATGPGEESKAGEGPRQKGPAAASTPEPPADASLRSSPDRTCPPAPLQARARPPSPLHRHSPLGRNCRVTRGMGDAHGARAGKNGDRDFFARPFHLIHFVHPIVGRKAPSGFPRRPFAPLTPTPCRAHYGPEDSPTGPSPASLSSPGLRGERSEAGEGWFEKSRAHSAWPGDGSEGGERVASEIHGAPVASGRVKKVNGVKWRRRKSRPPFSPAASPSTLPRAPWPPGIPCGVRAVHRKLPLHPGRKAELFSHAGGLLSPMLRCGAEIPSLPSAALRRATAHAHVPVRTDPQAHRRTSARAHTCMSAHAHERTRARAHTRTSAHAHKRMRAPTSAHALTHAHERTRAPTSAHALTHAHERTRA
jgi:hypothetical protein